jgi:hypothetical protein
VEKILTLPMIVTLIYSESKSESHYNWRSDSRSLLVSSPVLDSWPDISFLFWKLWSCQYGAPSLARGRVCRFIY